jgi:membrane-associated phospholipid phosphatase
MRPIVLLLALLPAAAPLASQEWTPSRGEAVAGTLLLGGALLVDRAVARGVPEGGGTRWEWASDALNHGGRPQHALLLLAGAASSGALLGSPPLRDGALRVGAGLLAAGVANGTLKVAVGRERPSRTSDPHRFRPGSLDNGWQSFPSGHAVVAFSLAAGLAEETREPVVAVLAYSAAGLVGWSRVYEGKHWTSDVVAGSLVGIFAGRGTVRLLRRGEGRAPALSVGPGHVAVRVALP